MILLKDAIDALEGTSIETIYYYNKRTNEILYANEFDDTYNTYTDESEFDDDIIVMFDYRDKDDYEIMQDFIQTIRDVELRKKLYHNTSGKGAFRMFRYLIDEAGITNDWYQYRDDKYKEIALEWCYKNNIDLKEE